MSAIRTALICTTQVPFTSGGAESHAMGLLAAMRRAGLQAELVSLPFVWNPPERIIQSALAWRLLDLTQANGRAVDLMVGLKFPAYLAPHPNKVLWILHQHRSAYNLRDTAFDDLSSHPNGAAVRGFVWDCDRRFIPEARRVFANSRTVAARLLRYSGIASEPLYHPPPLAAELHPGGFGDYVLCPGRLSAEKRPELLLEAMAHVRTPVRCVLAGASQDTPHYRALVDRRGLADRVVLAGWVDDRTLTELYAGALAVAYVPFDEDLGYVPLEAMLAAKPVVVARDSGGAVEFVEEGDNGFVVEPRPEAIAERLDQLYTERAMAREMGSRGAERYRALGLSWSRVVDRILEAAC